MASLEILTLEKPGWPYGGKVSSKVSKHAQDPSNENVKVKAVKKKKDTRQYAQKHPSQDHTPKGPLMATTVLDSHLMSVYPMQVII